MRDRATTTLHYSRQEWTQRKYPAYFVALTWLSNRPRPVVEHSRNLPGTTSNFLKVFDGSYLALQPPRPVVERRGNVRVIRA